MKKKTWEYIPPIRTSLPVYNEILNFLTDSAAGHPPDHPLSLRAKRVYRKWRKAEFKPTLVPFPEKKVKQ